MLVTVDIIGKTEIATTFVHLVIIVLVTVSHIVVLNRLVILGNNLWVWVNARHIFNVVQPQIIPRSLHVKIGKTINAFQIIPVHRSTTFNGHMTLP